MTNPSAKPSGTNNGGSGLAPNIASLLCYLCGPIVAIIFLVIEKENRDVRFHAWQEIFLSIAMIIIFVVLSVLSMIPYIGFLFFILYILCGLGIFALWILLMIKAYQGERWQIPVIGEYAEKQANA